VIEIGAHRLRYIATPHVPHAWEAQVLFDDSATHEELLARIDAGAEFAVTKAPAGADGETDTRARPCEEGMPMFVHTPGLDLRVLTAGDEPHLQAEQELISLIKRS